MGLRSTKPHHRVKVADHGGDVLRVFSVMFFDAGMEPGADLGPLVTRAAKARVEDLIAKGEEEGAKIILDGRGIIVPGYENGNFVGPTIIHHVKVGS